MKLNSLVADLLFRSILILISFNSITYGNEKDKILFTEFSDQIFEKEEISYTIKFDDVDSSLTNISIWKWRIDLVNDYTGLPYSCLVEDSVLGLNESTFTFTLDSIQFHYLSEIYLDQKARHFAKGYIIVTALDSDNYEHSIALPITVIDDLSFEGCGCMWDEIFCPYIPDTLILNKNDSIHVRFDDQDGSGTIAEFWSFEIMLFSNEGQEIILGVDSSYNINEYIWEINIQTIPDNKFWIRDNNRNIMGFIRVFTIDSDDWEQATYHEVKFIDNELSDIQSEFYNNPNSFRLYNNYPNPFNSNTIIKYRIEKQSYVKLEIFNTIGQKIETLVDETQAANEYSIKWELIDNNTLPSGTYICRLKVDNQLMSTRMLYMK